MNAMDLPKLEYDQEIIASFFESIEGELDLPDDSDHTNTYGEVNGDMQEFQIRLANTEERRGMASILINKMYSWRGYDNGTSLPDSPNRITILAYAGDNIPIGTMSVGLDSPEGLYADEMYHEELEALRRQGRKICEFNRLAIDPAVKSKRIIASLFHICYLYPRALFGHTDGVLEVNPRHVRFYEKMLGFIQIGPERTCPRVHAPAILMRTDFAYGAEQIMKFGGMMSRAKGERSLYPYFFNAKDEAGIIGRLKAMG